MSFDWDHQYCLACDRQTDGAVYCSESCKLADYEKTSAPSSGGSSPTLGFQPASWTTAPRQQSKFYLSPAYDFSKPTPYGTTPQSHSFLSTQSPASLPTNRRLTPSNSHSSLCSMQSSSSTGSEAPQLSDKATRELRAYASSFEQVRTQRRRSY
ncbi:uncharacterized protein MKZ38_008147 [Zalerion maritima]|uniref:Uncharacterized protein n=1 Tax=Zalerion maritima TaxID=339359 RepID=A0AAD5RI07_9PEZI|nr:uncharacterized protein MKZ38_008147 [Zalerion maritima]